MDRKGIIGVVVCIVAYFALTLTFSRMFPPVHRPAPPVVVTSPVTNGPALSAGPAISTNAPAADVTASNSTTPAPPIPSTPKEPEKFNVLENDDIKVTLTTRGASIKTIELKQHRDGDHGVILNEQSHDNVMAISSWPGADSISFQAQGTPDSLTYVGAVSGVTWTRTYHLDKEYTLTVQDAFANPGTGEAVLPAYSLSLGRAKPLLVKGQYQPSSNPSTGVGWLTTDKYHLTTVSAFNPTGFIVTTGPGHDTVSTTPIDASPLRWLAVQDQFFAVLLTPDARHPIPQAIFHCTNKRDEKGYVLPTDEPQIDAFANFPEIRLPGGQSTTIGYTLYTGPKEYNRLNALGDNQGELMNYDGWLPFSLLIRPMLWVLHGFDNMFHSYGIAIILLTLVIKGITWPLQSIANRSGKRMQALAPKIKELQAKYKEQPEKLNTETFGLYREFGVNPFGGCLPAFIQMPVFFSLFYMLQNAVELRGQHFLWVKDLTQPDTIFAAALPFTIPILNISHFIINPLPIMVTALMAVMMRMTPQIGDPQQQKIAQFMPLFFLFLFYNFAAALSLYYVMNNFVAIIQIYRNLKKPLPDLVRKPKKA